MQAAARPGPLEPFLCRGGILPPKTGEGGGLRRRLPASGRFASPDRRPARKRSIASDQASSPDVLARNSFRSSLPAAPGEPAGRADVTVQSAVRRAIGASSSSRAASDAPMCLVSLPVFPRMRRRQLPAWAVPLIWSDNPFGGRFPVQSDSKLSIDRRFRDVDSASGLVPEVHNTGVTVNNFRLRENGRSGGIRTHDPLTPSQVRYRAALRSEPRQAIVAKVRQHKRFSGVRRNHGRTAWRCPEGPNVSRLMPCRASSAMQPQTIPSRM